MGYVAAVGDALRLSADLRPWLDERVRLYYARDGVMLALRNDPSGPLSVETVASSLDRRINSTLLAEMVRLLRRDDTGRVPACYADGPDAVLIARDQKDLDEDMDEETFLGRFFPMDTEKLRCQSMELTGRGVCFGWPFPTRSEVVRRGETLAFLRCDNGMVAGQKTEGGMLFQAPEVVDFARRHWKGRPLFRRMVEGATVVSPDPIGLSRCDTLEGFRPLDRALLRRSLWVDVGRMYTLEGAPEIAELLGERAAVCCYGDYLALTANEDGDVEIHDGQDRTRFASLPLGQQLMARFGATERLYLVPYGDLLIFSDSPEEDGVEYPPQDYFCRLLMKPIRVHRLMRYGVDRNQPLAKDQTRKASRS